MEKSLDNITILLNPGSKYWSQVLESIAANEGWMYNAEDYWTMTSTIDKFWMFLAIDRKADEAVGSVCLAYEPSVSGEEDEDVYSLGLYYVCPEWRGKGVGSALFDKVMKIGQSGNMVLLGAPKMSPLYASKHGFDKMPNYQYISVTMPTEHIAVTEPDSEYVIKDLDNVDWKSVIAYATKISKRYRPKYFIKFITSGDFRVKVASSNSQEVVGICAIRPIGLSNYLMIQPFYADNAVVAKSLLSSTLASIPNIKEFSRVESIYPGSNEAARRLPMPTSLQPSCLYSMRRSNNSLLLVSVLTAKSAPLHLDPTHVLHVYEAIGGKHTEFKPHTQPAFTKKLLSTGDERVFAVLDITITFI